MRTWFGASVAQPRQVERQQVAALGGRQRMQLVEDDRVEVGEQIGRSRGATAAASAARASSAACRAAAGAGAPSAPRRCRRYASRCGSADPSPRSASSGCGRRRRPAPSAARCRACAGPPPAAAWRSQSATRLGRKPASVLPAPVGAISSVERRSATCRSSASWCSRGCQPRALNQAAERRRQGDRGLARAAHPAWLRALQQARGLRLAAHGQRTPRAVVTEGAMLMPKSGANAPSRRDGLRRKPWIGASSSATASAARYCGSCCCRSSWASCCRRSASRRTTSSSASSMLVQRIADLGFDAFQLGLQLFPARRHRRGADLVHRAPDQAEPRPEVGLAATTVGSWCDVDPRVAQHRPITSKGWRYALRATQLRGPLLGAAAGGIADAR